MQQVCRKTVYQNAACITWIIGFFEFQRCLNIPFVSFFTITPSVDNRYISDSVFPTFRQWIQMINAGIFKYYESPTEIAKYSDLPQFDYIF